jgi:hypothetical protein
VGAFDVDFYAFKAQVLTPASVASLGSVWLKKSKLLKMQQALA